jgi:hypothetical protein
MAAVFCDSGSPPPLSALRRALQASGRCKDGLQELEGEAMADELEGDPSSSASCFSKSGVGGGKINTSSSYLAEAFQLESRGGALGGTNRGRLLRLREPAQAP